MIKNFVIIICAGGLLAISGCVGKDRQVQNHMAWLNSGNPVIRNRAITQLGTLGQQKAAPVLRKFLSREYPRDTRLLTVRALGNLGDAGSVELLVPILAEPDTDIKLATVEALGKIHDQRGIVPLAGMLNDQDAQLTAIWALGNIRHTNATPCLTGLLTSQDKFVRYNALQALKKIGSGR